MTPRIFSVFCIHLFVLTLSESVLFASTDSEKCFKALEVLRQTNHQPLPAKRWLRYSASTVIGTLILSSYLWAPEGPHVQAELLPARAADLEQGQSFGRLAKVASKIEFRTNPTDDEIQTLAEFEFELPRGGFDIRRWAKEELPQLVFDERLTGDIESHFISHIKDRDEKILLAYYSLLDSNGSIAYSLTNKVSLGFKGNFAARTLIASSYSIQIEFDENRGVERLVLRYSETNRHPGGMARFKMSTNQFFTNVRESTIKYWEKTTEKLEESINSSQQHRLEREPN